MQREPLVVIVACPNCGGGCYGAWLEPAARGEPVEASLQECPSCGTRMVMDFPR